MWQILGWIVWSIAALLAVSCTYGLRKDARFGGANLWSTGVGAFVLLTVSILFLVFGWHKLHMLWVAPISVCAIMLLSTSTIPPISPLLRFLIGVFSAIVVTGIDLESPDEEKANQMKKARSRSHRRKSKKQPSEAADRQGEEKRLAMTTTGEIYQPIRLYYSVSSFRRVVRIFYRLRCVEFDPSQKRWVWLYTDEASSIKFGKKADSDEPIVLGSFLKKGSKEMVLDVRSFERAIEALVFFDNHIPRRVAKVTDAAIVNRLFDVQDGISSTFDHFFDEQFVERSDPEELLQKLKHIGSKARNETEKRVLILAYIDERSREPFPEIERFPLHFYEDGAASLPLPFRARQAIAIQHWLGNTSYTYANYVQEITQGLRANPAEERGKSKCGKS